MRGLNSDEKRTKLYDWLNDCNINIALIQETHYIERHIIKYNSRWFGESCLISFHLIALSQAARNTKQVKMTKKSCPR